MERDNDYKAFVEFMNKWHYKDFKQFENHFNVLMSMKNRDQLMSENRVLKDTLGEVLAQKKKYQEQCIRMEHLICAVAESVDDAYETLHVDDEDYYDIDDDDDDNGNELPPEVSSFIRDILEDLD